jgi:hypothetical protein
MGSKSSINHRILIDVCESLILTGVQKFAPPAPAVPDKPHLVGQNEI